MKEYRIIGQFFYELQKYELLLDSDRKYFFLKINDDDKREYVSLKEFLKLAMIFTYNDNILLITNNYNQTDEEYYKKNKRSLIKLIPKIKIGTKLTTLSLSLLLLLSGCTLNSSLKSNNKFINFGNFEQSISSNDDKVKIDETQKAIDEMNKRIEKQKKDFKVEDESDGVNLKVIYDNTKLDEALGYTKDKITYDMIRELISSNSDIPNKYKDIYTNLANNLEKEYPTLDLRIWYENLKTLKILEVDEMEMKVKAVSVDAYACYRKDENTIYTVKDYNYVPNTWDYQVIVHEMCHPIRSGKIINGKLQIKTQFENKSGNGIIIGEALNSLFSLRSYDKDEKDIAYQLQSNMIEIMVESMDNYTYQDYIEHNITYFENELNKQNNDDLAVDILELINLQYKDYHNDKIYVEQSQFYKVYDYIAKMYYRKHISPTMSYDDALKVKDELVERITYDVPSEYNIDTSHFTDYFNDYYYQLTGVNNAKSK